MKSLCLSLLILLGLLLPYAGWCQNQPIQKGGVQPGVYVMSKTPHVDEILHIAIALPAKHGAQQKWKVLSGDSDIPWIQGYLAGSGTLIVKKYSYRSPGHYVPLLVIMDNSNTPIAVYPSAVDVRTGVFEENLQKFVGFLLGVFSTILIFFLKYLLEIFLQSRNREKQLKCKLHQICYLRLKHLKRKPNVQFPDLPAWFCGQKDIEFYGMLFTKRYSDIRMSIEEAQRIQRGSPSDPDGQVRKALEDALEKTQAM